MDEASLSAAIIAPDRRNAWRSGGEDHNHDNRDQDQDERVLQRPLPTLGALKQLLQFVESELAAMKMIALHRGLLAYGGRILLSVRRQRD